MQTTFFVHIYYALIWALIFAFLLQFYSSHMYLCGHVVFAADWNPDFLSPFLPWPLNANLVT